MKYGNQLLKKGGMAPGGTRLAAAAKKSNLNVLFVTNETRLVDHILDSRIGNPVMVPMQLEQDTLICVAPSS
jgi:hypothetical protein